MKILIAVKQVAALDEDFEIRADGRDVEEEFLIRDLNEWDDYSLEEAVKIKEASSDPVEVRIAVEHRPLHYISQFSSIAGPQMRFHNEAGVARETEQPRGQRSRGYREEGADHEGLYNTVACWQ